ncbi:MAG: PIN domain-containing protein [Nitrosomonadales bacterium]|nr:PIN domain-containing protein [Nitrosomonadales bacterium]
MKYVLDTNTLIYLQGGKLAERLPVGAYAYSVISEIELLSWPEIQPEQEHIWRGLLATLHRVEVDASVRETAIRLRRERRLKLPDALIAASAFSLDATLLTNDQRLLTLPGLRSQTLELKNA